MSIINDAKKLVEYMVTTAVIRSTVNNPNLTSSEKIMKINSQLNKLDASLKEVDDEKAKTKETC